MKIVKKVQRKLLKNSRECDAFEYGLGCDSLGGVVVEVRGRHPEKGRVVNLECEEMAYILEGKGKISVDGVEHGFAAGDIILIGRGERYFWDGKFSAFLSSAPAWTVRQCNAVD